MGYWDRTINAVLQYFCVYNRWIIVKLFSIGDCLLGDLMVPPTIINHHSYYEFCGGSQSSSSIVKTHGSDIFLSAVPWRWSCQEVFGVCGARRPSTVCLSVSTSLRTSVLLTAPLDSGQTYDPCSSFWIMPQKSRWEKEHFCERIPISAGHVCWVWVSVIDDRYWWAAD